MHRYQILETGHWDRSVAYGKAGEAWQAASYRQTIWWCVSSSYACTSKHIRPYMASSHFMPPCNSKPAPQASSHDSMKNCPLKSIYPREFEDAREMDTPWVANMAFVTRSQHTANSPSKLSRSVDLAWLVDSISGPDGAAFIS